jgi:sodium-dependent dicarboxylate transporter 2/3/5
MSTESTKTNSNKQTIHAIITLALMFGIGLIPPVSLLTVTGMKIVGILIGAIYGVTFCQPAWPCMAAMAALVIHGVAPVGTVLSTGIGSDSIMLMIFFFAFVAVLEANRITEFMATWLLTRKFLQGKPWVFSYLLIVGTMFCGAFGSSFPAMMVFWSILITTCNLYGLKPFTKYPTVMFMGICIGGLASSSTWLFRGNPLFVNATLKGISGGALEINFGIYAFFSFVMWMLVIAAYILVCKYVFKVDVGALKNVDDSVVDKSYLVLNARQKVVMMYTVLVLVVYCAIGFTPTASAAGQYFATFGTTMPIVIILTLMAITRIDGEALMDFNSVAKRGVVWDTVILSGALLCLSTIMMTSNTGVAESILSILNPVFAGKGTTFMCIIIVVISVILTNFMANTTVGLMFCPVIYSFSVAMGFNPMPMMVMMLISIHIAYLTPAASPFASLLFGFSGTWFNASDIYKLGTLACVLMVAIFLLIGIPLSNILF